MNSFYGGKQGRTYHIVARYDCVNIISFINEYKIDQEQENITNEAQILQYQTGIEYKVGQVFKHTLNSSTIFYLVKKDFIGDENNYLENTVSIKGMVQEFSKGGTYTEANYGQYVLIDTIQNRNHKSDLENGLLFRRGFDYNQVNFVEKPNINDEQFYDVIEEDGGRTSRTFKKAAWQSAWSAWVENVGAGAIYVGQIVGPQGDSPELFPIKWEEISLENNNVNYRSIVPVSQSDGFHWEYEEGYDQTSPDATQHRTGVYNDTIKVATVTLKDADNNITGAQIAFDIPVPIFKVSAQVVNAYGKEANKIEEQTRNHYDEASDKTDTEIEINVLKDETGKIIGYNNLLHQHSATGKWAFDKNNEKTSHPFYLNYDIAVPRGIHGNNMENYKISTGEEIVQNTNAWIYDVKEWQYEEKIDEGQWDIKEWEYDPEYPEGSEGAEQHRIPIYWSKNDEGWEEHYTPVYWTDQDEGYENHRTPLSYWQPEDDGFEEHRKIYDSEQKELISNDKYITFSIRNFDKQENGNIIETYEGRFPYRVIETIKENINNRIYFTYVEGAENQVQIGDIYKYNLEDYNYDYFAICIHAGTVPSQNFFNISNIKTGIIIGQTNTSVWRVLRLPKDSSAFELIVDYQAGQDDHIDTHFLDYFYMDDNGYIHTVDANQIDNIIGFVNSINSIEYNYSTGQFVFYLTKDNDVLEAKRFKVNVPLDIKRLGDNIAILYSDPDDIDPNAKYYTFNYKGEDRQYKVLANLNGQYHLFGKYQLIDLVRYKNDPSDTEYQYGKLYYGLEHLSPSELPEGMTQEQWEEAIKERAGWIVSIESHEVIYENNWQAGMEGAEQHIEKEEDIITLYAYDYNSDNYSSGGKPPYVITVEGIGECNSFWYPIESVSASMFDPTYVYLVDKENTNHLPATKTLEAMKLRNDGLWFVLSTGHDNY